MITDMRHVTTPKSDQMNADDLIGGPRTIMIKEVKLTPGEDQPVSVFFDGDDGKPYKPCKSMARLMMAAWGANASLYGGRSMTLYNDPAVKWGGIAVGGIRISHMSHIDSDIIVALTATRGKKSPYKVKALVQVPAEPDAPQLTLEKAQRLLTDAKDMKSLKDAWVDKAMAPFRDELTDFLAKCKEALSGQESAQPSTTVSVSPTQETDADVPVIPAFEPEQKVEAGSSAPKPEMWKQLVGRAAAATSLDQVIVIQAEFDLAEQYIAFADQGKVQDAITAARLRLEEKFK